MTARATLAAHHLLLRLRPINRALRCAVESQASEAAQLDRPELANVCVTDRQAQVLLDRVESLPLPGQGPGSLLALTPEEAAVEEALRRSAVEAETGLPLDELVAHLDLTPTEQAALLICAAPEVDRGYERIFAYILDDLNRRSPCVELLCTLTTTSTAERLAARATTGRFGRLRLLGLVQAIGEDSSHVRQAISLAPGVMEFLLGLGGEPAVLAEDPAAVDIVDRVELPHHVDPADVERLGMALRDGLVDVVGVWGPARNGRADVLRALALVAGRPLRRLARTALPTDPAVLTSVVRAALNATSLQEAILWVSLDELPEEDGERSLEALAETLSRSSVPILLSGGSAWRPATIIAARAFAEIELHTPGFRARRDMWSATVPEVTDGRLDELAARYRIGSEDTRAVASMARVDMAIRRNGDGPLFEERLAAAAAAIARRRSGRFARIVVPNRTANDLVLPASLHAQILEIAAFFGAWPKVAEDWGFDRLAGHGIKALFTGEPGTGKTLAAEVIAGTLALPLLKVDLARVVSKWVGETEKNLEAAFQEAADGHSVLFFDEADALFGKRGEIRHGTDRYANLEVGYLLQRLEEHDGLVILASNLVENIDEAFTRRFHFVVHFPRPGLAERRGIWAVSFPPAAPLAPDVDLDALSDLDMTGASIVGAARTAALLAAREGGGVIEMRHVVRGIARQFHRESRLLRPDDLAGYALLLDEELESETLR